jgi:hypothetical protein
VGGGAGEGEDQDEGAVRPGGLPRAAGVPEGQRVHPPPLPLRVAAPAGAALRLHHPQRDAQRLDVRNLQTKPLIVSIGGS